MEFHARFSNYEAWLTDPINIKPSAQVVWPIVGQDILNADVGFHEFKSPPACSTFDLLVLQIHSSFIALPLAVAAADAVCWLVYYHKRWFQNVSRC